MDINVFVKFVSQKNDVLKITHDVGNEGAMYRHLKSMGYGRSVLDGKRVYFKRTTLSIAPTSIKEIRLAFRDFLEHKEFVNVPSSIKREDILNWYYQKRPIKENGLLEHYLTDTLSREEEHSLRMQTNIKYEHEFETTELIQMLGKWEFVKIENQNTICYKSDLFYRSIDHDTFIVFTHFNIGTLQSGFDMWSARYNSKNHIGKKEPFYLKDLKLGFNLSKDAAFLSPYFNFNTMI